MAAVNVRRRGTGSPDSGYSGPHQEKSAVTAFALTSSRGWFRWL